METAEEAAPGPHVFDPVIAPSTFEETVERLGVAIRLGLLEPGTRLPAERELAARMRISRATLRRAITTLVQSGYLRATRGRGGGTFVVEEPPLADPGDAPHDDWREMLDLRMAIELGCLLLAVERATPEQLAALREQVATMSSATTFHEYRRADTAFHIGVAQATRVPRLVSLMTELQASLSSVIGRIAHPAEVLDQSNAEHAALVDALERRDRTTAEELLQAHLTGTRHIVGGFLA